MRDFYTKRTKDIRGMKFKGKEWHIAKFAIKYRIAEP